MQFDSSDSEFQYSFGVLLGCVAIAFCLVGTLLCSGKRMENNNVELDAKRARQKAGYLSKLGFSATGARKSLTFVLPWH